MLTEEDINKIKHYLSDNYNEDDERNISKVFCDTDKERELKSFLMNQFSEVSENDALSESKLNQILYKIHYEINTNQPETDENKISKLLKWTIRVAGIILLPFILYWGVKGYLYDISNKNTWIEIKAPPWTRAQFNLPDGTIGWLNSNSSIKYKGNFKTDRQIILKGEAFFDVYEDKRTPFVVDANEVIVKVLGTKFNIASFEDDTIVEVVLEEGSLEINNRNLNKSHTMQPDDFILYNKKLDEFEYDVVDPQKYISWKDGKLVFRNDPIDLVAERLERWYNIDVEVRGIFAEEIMLRATFVDESLNEVLYFLKRSLPITYEIELGNIQQDQTFVKTKLILLPKKN